MFKFRWKKRQISGLILISLFLLINIQPFITYAIESNKKTSKLFLTAKPSRIVTQHYTLLDAKLVGKVDEEWIPLNNEKVQFYIKIDGTWTYLGEARTDETGHATLEVFIELPQDQYLIKAIFAGTLLYESVEGEKHINVLEEAHDVVLSEPQYVVPWGDVVNLTATILNPAGKPIPNRALNFSVYLETAEFSGWVTLPSNYTVIEDEDGEQILVLTYDLKTNKDGKAVQPYIPPRSTGLFDLKVTYKGGKSQGFGEKIFWNALKVIRRTSVIDDNLIFTGYYGDPVTLTARLHDHSNAEIPYKDVNIYLKEGDNWNLISTVNTGETGAIQCSFYPNLAPGIYQIKFEFQGDALYTPVEREGILEIKKEITVINNNFIKVEVPYTDTVSINPIFTDDEGDPLASKQLNFYISYDFTTYTFFDSSMTNSNGIASIDYTAIETPGSYSLFIEFLGDTYYEASQLYGSLIITKEHTDITVPDVQISDSQATLIAVLQEDDGPPIGGVPIKFYLHYDGIEEFIDEVYTDSSGEARKTITIQPGQEEAVIFAEFEGNDYYFAITGHDGFIIPPKPAEITIENIDQDPSGLFYFKIRVTDENGNPVYPLDVDFLISDTNIHEKKTAPTDQNGIAEIYYDPHGYTGTLSLIISTTSTRYSIPSASISLLSQKGVGTEIVTWLMFVGFVTSGESAEWWFWIGAMYAAVFAAAAIYAWLEGGNGWWGFWKVPIVIGALVGILASAIYTINKVSQYSYSHIEHTIFSSISHLDPGAVKRYYYWESWVVSDELNTYVKNAADNSIALIILGDYFKDTIKGWFSSSQNADAKNKLYLTVLDYPWSYSDRNIFHNKYTISFEKGYYPVRNQYIKEFFWALAYGSPQGLSVEAAIQRAGVKNSEWALWLAFRFAFLIVFPPFAKVLIWYAIVVAFMIFALFLVILEFQPHLSKS